MMENEQKSPVNGKINNSELDAMVLENNLAKIAYTLDKDYLTHLDDYGVLKFDRYCTSRGIEYLKNETKNIMAIKVTNFIINKDEKVIDCMKNVIGSFSNTSDSLGFLVHRKVDSVDIYFIFKKDGEIARDYVNAKIELYDKSFTGNFPGSKTKVIKQDSELNKEFTFLDNAKHITLLTSIPSDKSEDYISQGIEKLLNGFVPEKNDNEYAVLILAEAMPQEGVREVINGFEEMATSITPYAGHQFQTGSNDSESHGEMKSTTDTTGVSHAISKTHSINIGANVGRGVTNTSGINNVITDSEGNTDSDSITNSEGDTVSDTTNESKMKGSNDNAGVSLLGVNYSHGWNRSTTEGTAKTIARNVAKSVAKSTAKTVGRAVAAGTFSSVAKMLSFGLSGGYGYSWGKIDTDSESKSLTDGTNHNITLGTSESNTYNYKSYQVTDLLEVLETNIKRLTKSKSTGLWKTATYVFSENGTTSQSVANYLRGLTQGDESFIESATVFDWKEQKDKSGKIIETTPFPEIKKYLTHFTHPIFINRSDLLCNTVSKDYLMKEIDEALHEETENNESLSPDIIENAQNDFRENIEKINIQLIPITPTTNISTTELAKLFALPTHSLPGLPVLECAEFGRNVATYDEQRQDNNHLSLGKVYHMHDTEKLDVSLQKKSLASHTFITGSTGSGKSNTVYHLLSQAEKNECKFLVIEPAKGEYKHVFGNTAHVYGTNKKLSDLLRINPFSFPSDIHILEHLDRLIEIFNVCWPMYAAMPAILKEAVEKSYEDCGWNLAESSNEYGENLYPTFADVTRNIRTIIDSSEYDNDNKGAYKGSLITRLKSLTNGINGQIFTTDEISDAKLFDENVIVDLSRVGSSETKSLIMGLLVLKLQEYRMTSGRMNSDLQHITVLEEAHNLLKRTSTEQSSESSNLIGKSVEMIANSIAEMRTYGEGFIIADQAPGLLDMSVIRNTNTKIIMRLPDLGDRELVGRAANLNNNQIEELAKLPCGVAAVYQNEWVQPVLCKVNHYPIDDNSTFEYESNETSNSQLSFKNRIVIAQKLCNLSKDSEKLEEMKTLAKKHLTKKSIYKLSGSVYVSTMRYIESTRKKPDYDKLTFIVSSLLPEFTKIIKDSAIRNPNKPRIWRDDLQDHIHEILAENKIQDTNLRNNILQCILQSYVISELNKPNLLNEILMKNTL